MRLGVEAALVRRELVPGDVEVVDGRVSRVGLPAFDGKGVASPGFIDLQVNGLCGVDFLEADAEGYRVAREALLQAGVTAFLPTFITAPEERLAAALEELPRDSQLPRLLGAHLEGPFLAPTRLGAHPAAARRDPDPALLERLLDAGPVRLVTLAPELPGADDLIALLHRRGVTVSCGHTDADAQQASQAFDRGVRTVTHLFNAMRPFDHRDPGIAGVALAREDVVVQVILDGAHLAPDTAKLIWQVAGGRVALVTDSMAGAGLDDGAHRLGGIDVQVADGVSRRLDGALAGSSLTMIQAVRNLVSLGVPLAHALDAATAVPARVIGLADSGGLVSGAPADIVVLDDNLGIDRVLVGGAPR